MHLAFVQVPPRGLWGRSAQVRSTTAESWLGKPFVADPSIDAVVLLPGGVRPGIRRRCGDVVSADRAARGRRAAAPAPRHVSGRARPRALRPTGRAETARGHPRARPLPARVRQRPALPRRPQPVLLRSRPCIAGACLDQIGWGSMLHDDGVVSGRWRLETEGLVVCHVDRLRRNALATIAAEGRKLARFLGAEAPSMRLTPLRP